MVKALAEALSEFDDVPFRGLPAPAGPPQSDEADENWSWLIDASSCFSQEDGYVQEDWFPVCGHKRPKASDRDKNEAFLKASKAHGGVLGHYWRGAER